MRLLALDVGDRRVGVAISDPLGLWARPLTVLVRRSKEHDYRAIAALVQEHEASLVIVGHPLDLDGTPGPQARRVERYVAGLVEHLPVPVVLWDERLSTAEAERILHEAGETSRQYRGRLDAVAAAVILQSYLNAVEERERSVDQ
ncbi:MAG: Holliday junction resolvase RuvX [Anaerolineae bacterium]|nr:Holliday junction resolvase RuvX [Anaerolineae bacterium]